MSKAPNTVHDADGNFADYFRHEDVVLEDSLAWQIQSSSQHFDALRGIFQGAPDLVRFRLWMLLTLVRQTQYQFTRGDIEGVFHAARIDAMDTVLKRFREVQILDWDETQRVYSLTALGQRCAALLAALAESAPDELSELLSQVVGAEQLGTLQGGQVQLLQSQLLRLHQEFEEAITSGSEFRLREARKRYDRASRLIDKASGTITSIISNAKGQQALEQAARGLGLAQARLLAMASQFNRALQQADRQRITLGSTGMTNTDVKRWLQQVKDIPSFLSDALHRPLRTPALAQHELLDVTEAEFERDRPTQQAEQGLPSAQAAPEGQLTAVALPRELGDLVRLLNEWAQPLPKDNPITQRPVSDALLAKHQDAELRFAQVAYKLQLLPLLGDAQAAQLPGSTGELARLPWLLEWSTSITSTPDTLQVEALSDGQLLASYTSTP
jgi:hypothetical protein